MAKGLEAAIKGIKAAGFTHVKVELEAELNREDQESRYDECTVCTGSGYIELDSIDEEGDRLRAECDDCYGEGEVEADRTDFGDEDVCEQFIKDHISTEALAAINYMNFYDDGSVDSELTFTLPIDEPKYILEVIEAFKLLAEENGQGMDVDGAGMHMSVLTSGRYPTDRTLPYENMDNFKREVSKLLPALFVTATSGDFTRGLQYRYPRISNDDKYSAIFTHRDTCLEYRLFETCYQRPEAIFEYLGVIARTLEYYTDTSKKVASVGQTYPVYGSKGLKGFVDLPEQVSIIKKQLSLLKPAGYTIREILEARGIDLSVTKARKKQEGKLSVIKMAYKEHHKAWETSRKRELNEFEKDNIEYYRRERPGMTDDWYWERVTGRSASVEDEATYIMNNISDGRPDVMIAV